VAPTPAYQLLEDPDVPYLNWEIGNEAPAVYQQSLREGILLMHQHAVSLGLPEMKNDATVYVFRNLDAMYAAYARARGWSLEYARWHMIENPVTAEASPRSIFVNLANITEDDFPVSRFVGMGAHELFHIYQYGLGSLTEFDIDLSDIGVDSRYIVRSTGPTWLMEGAAIFQSLRARNKAGLYPTYEQRREGWYVPQARSVDTPLDEMETSAGLSAGSGGYPYGTMATELLASRAGEKALLSYWSVMGPETPWREAFQTAFGMTIEEFYVLFEEHRAAGFPKLEFPRP
jgi:hypothetical protein